MPDRSERSGRQIMKYAYQVMIIGGISFAGELLNTLLPLPVPASVYGMVILLICLCTKVIRLNQIQETADFMLAAMRGIRRPRSSTDGILRIDERFSSWNCHNFHSQHGSCHDTDWTDRTVPGD